MQTNELDQFPLNEVKGSCHIMMTELEKSSLPHSLKTYRGSKSINSKADKITFVST